MFNGKQSKIVIACVKANNKHNATAFLNSLSTQELCDPVYRRIVKNDVELISKYVEIRKLKYE